MDKRVEFLNDFGRMCKSYDTCSDGCPFYIERRNLSLGNCRVFMQRYPEIAVKAIDKWVKEHPRATYLTEFLEKYPNAKLDKDGIPEDICPHFLGLKVPYDNTCHGTDCITCWNTVMTERGDYDIEENKEK